MAEKHPTVWTIGHSTRSPEEFLTALQSFEIEILVDVRRFPGSKKYPHFNKAELALNLPKAQIDYLHLEELGGRRKPVPDSRNTVWQNEAFRGYADYTETAAFEKALGKLTEVAVHKRTAYMCAEAVWWRCHRAIISDCLKAEGWLVMHIMQPGVAKEHPFTAAYREMLP